MAIGKDRREALIELARLGGLASAAGASAYWLSTRSRRPEEEPAAAVNRNLAVPANPRLPELAIVRGGDPRALLRNAVEALGGIRRFVSRGDVVAVKPNAAWDRTPEQAANTGPAVVAETVRLCREAGAKAVIVADVSINDPRRAFDRSGIGAAARAAGARVVLPGEAPFRHVDLSGELLRGWPVFEPFLESDRVINLAAAKHHSLTGVSLGIKNLYGILGGDRPRLHQHIHESLADLAAFLRPTLSVIDGFRVLVRNGPNGGNREDVSLEKTLMASTDPVALDACAAAAWWKLDPPRYLELAAARGLGSTRWQNVRRSS